MDTFHYTFFAQQVVFGAGSLDQLGDLADRFHWRRLLLCVTPSFRTRGRLASIEATLGARLAATYEGVRPHVPEDAVADATTLAEASGVDAVIGLGGGSAIGTAKAVSMALEAARSGRGAGVASPTDQPLIPVIAIPTTYAGSEMTPVYGVTHEGDGLPRKVTVRDPRVTPKLVIYDPLLTLDLPPRVTGGAGINALAHCIEALYSITRNPLSTAAALGGLRAIMPALPRCVADGSDVEARGELLAGAFLAGTALSNVTMGLHHGICHVIGGSTGAAHGDANSVMLPHVMRFNLDVTAPQLALAADAMGIPTGGRSAAAAGEAAAQAVAELVEQLRLPTRLRAIGVQEEQLSELAQMAFASRTVRDNPRPISDVAEIEALLRRAW